MEIGLLNQIQNDTPKGLTISSVEPIFTRNEIAIIEDDDRGEYE